MSTVGVFRYAEPGTAGGTGQLGQPGSSTQTWSKVDTDVTSFRRVERKRSVTNLRTAEGSSFGVNVSGFELLRDVPAREKDFVDEAAVRQGYYAEVEQLLRDKLSTPDEEVRRVVIFDHTIRRRDPTAARQPVQQVHIDQTPAAAATRVRRHVADASEAEALLQGRYQIINVWRPIGHAASDTPLAVIDWRTTETGDAVPVDLLYPNTASREADSSAAAEAHNDDAGKEVLPDPALARSTEGYTVKGQTYTVVPNDKHKFYYVKDMMPNEVLLLKCFDSRSQVHEGGRSGVADWSPHTAFTDPNTPPGTKGRQSIEVRCLVFYGKA